MAVLAVSVASVNVMFECQNVFYLHLLPQFSLRVSKPLVLHGGTGISAASLREAVAMGVTKVNYGTYLKQRYLAHVSASITASVDNPHELLGIGSDRDIMIAGRCAVRDAVLERIGWLGCCGKANCHW